MVILETLRRDKRQAILDAAEEHGVQNVRVFGSVARGECTENSDLDLLVDLKPGRTLYDLAGFVADVEDLLGVRVDVATSGGLRYIKERVFAEAVAL